MNKIIYRYIAYITINSIVEPYHVLGKGTYFFTEDGRLTLSKRHKDNVMGDWGVLGLSNDFELLRSLARNIVPEFQIE